MREAHVKLAMNHSASLAAMKILLNSCADIGSPGFGTSLLICIIESNVMRSDMSYAMEYIKALAEGRAEANSTSNYPWDLPLLLAVRKGLVLVTDYLVRNGVRLNILVDGHPVGAQALFVSARDGRYLIMRSLIDHGAKITEELFNGVLSDQTKPQSGIHVYGRGCSELRIQKATKITNVLVNSNFSRQTRSGLTIRIGAQDCSRVLIQDGTTITDGLFNSNFSGQTMLHAAVEARSWSARDCSLRTEPAWRRSALTARPRCSRQRFGFTSR